MPSFETLLVFTLAAFVMNLSPGPSNFYVMSLTLGQGPRAGATAALGLATGSLVHVAAAAFGLAALFAYSPTAYLTIKLIGAAYLVYLGWCWLCDSETSVAPLIASSLKSTGRIFKESVLVEVLNPKTALFFVAFLPQFVDSNASNAQIQFIVLGLVVTLTGVPCDLFVAWFAHRAVRFLSKNPWFATLQNRLAGTILIGLGVYVALSERPR